MVWANFLWLSLLHPATCGESKTFSDCINFLKVSGVLLSINKASNELFSYSKTSNPAPKICPDSNANSRSLVTTLLPRAVLRSQKGLVNLAINWRLTICFVSGFQGYANSKPLRAFEEFPKILGWHFRPQH